MATLREMRNAVHRRMGDPLAGKFGQFRYITDAPGQTTDEVGLAINEAQALTSRDCYVPEYYPLLRYDSEIPVVSGRDIYTLPQDFIAIEELRYVRGAQNYPMTRKSIKQVRRRLDRVLSGAVLQYYDYQGMTSIYIAEGTVAQTDEFAIRDPDATFSKVRIGDIVYNLTDGSEGIVRTTEEGLVWVEELQGGRANMFDRGDSYAISTQEESRWALQTYPRVTATDKILFSGEPIDFELSESNVVVSTGIWVQFTSLPEGYEKDETIKFCIFEGETLLHNPYGPSEIGRENLMIGWNPLEIERNPDHKVTTESNFERIDYSFNIQFRQGETYSIRAYREDGTEIPISMIRLMTRSDDRMLMTFARTPRELKTENSIFELPVDYLEPTYKRTKIILHEKLNPHGVAPQLWTEYENECDKVELNFSYRDESGPYDFETDGDGEIMDYHRDTNWTPFFG